MTTAMNPNPVPDSRTLSSRPSGLVGARSPYPSVKKVSPLKYKHEAKLGGSFTAPSGTPIAHCSNPKAIINDPAQEANKQNSENGPNQLKKCCRMAPRRKLSAMLRQ